MNDYRFPAVKIIREEKSEACVCKPVDPPHSFAEYVYLFFYSFKNFTLLKIFCDTFLPNQKPLSQDVW
jgi:hypothetical protein